MLNKIYFTLIEVQVRLNNVDYSLKMLKKKMQREGIFKIIKEKKYYIKPSKIKSEKSIKMKRELRKIKYNNNNNNNHNCNSNSAVNIK